MAFAVHVVRASIITGTLVTGFSYELSNVIAHPDHLFDAQARGGSIGQHLALDGQAVLPAKRRRPLALAGEGPKAALGVRHREPAVQVGGLVEDHLPHTAVEGVSFCRLLT